MIKIVKKGSFKIDQMAKNVKVYSSVMPKIVANEALNHFHEGFRQGGKQTDKSRGGWKKRKRIDRKRAGRAILVDTGDLRSDIKKRVVNSKRVIVGTRNINYAIYHNEGTEKMPQREFIGESRVLKGKIKRIIERQLNKIKP